LAKGGEQRVSQPRIASEQGLGPGHNVLDHLVESSQLFPGVAVSIETRDVVGLLAMMKELVEQHDRVGILASQDIDQRFLRACRPLQRRGVDRVGPFQKVLVNGMAALMGRHTAPLKLARMTDFAWAYEHP